MNFIWVLLIEKNCIVKVLHSCRRMPSPPRKIRLDSLPADERPTSPHAAISPDAMEHVAELSEINTSYAILMVTSGVLAAIAMLTNSIPVLIGSMIIALAKYQQPAIAAGILPPSTSSRLSS